MTENDKALILTNLDSIRRKIEQAREKSPLHQKVSLLLATKTRTPEEINFAIGCGVTLIGENRVQELLSKYEAIDRKNAKIHFIGALQTNKVKYIIDKVDMIQSVDRLSLAKEIDRQAEKRGIIMKILCEINIGREKTKSGVAPEEAEEFLRALAKLKNIRVCGLMAIPPKMTSIDQQKQYFQKIMDFDIDISKKKIDNVNTDVISIGMSEDFPLAIECGSNLVRIGTAAFGPRTNNNLF